MQISNIKPNSVLKQLPRFPNRKALIEYLGSSKLLKLLQQDYGLKPIIKTHKMTCYSAKHVEDACIMLERGISPFKTDDQNQQDKDQAA